MVKMFVHQCPDNLTGPRGVLNKVASTHGERHQFKGRGHCDS